MRIDKFLSSSTSLSRSQISAEIKKGKITLNGETVKKGDVKIDENKDEILFNGEKINYSEFIYIKLNKPKGVISASDDSTCKTVIDLLPSEYKSRGLFPCGRLDKDTTGLIILTNDGKSCHNNLSPKKHVEKKYYFQTADTFSDDDVCVIENGVNLKDGYTTKPAKIQRIDDFSGYITLSEGKYHEIKRIFGALNNRIVELKRVSFSKITLGDLQEGQWAYLTNEEIEIFKR